MSRLYVPKQALSILTHRLAETKIYPETNIIFITSYPRSDMGKGTIVANLLNLIPDSNAIKFDGLLNTNANGRHTAIGHDDFGIYEKFNPGKRWTDENYILAGQLIKDFINDFGEFENLPLKPYLSLYLKLEIQKIWQKIGKPKTLIIEIGGVMTDCEVDTYVPLAINLIKEQFSEKVKIILLSEIGYNNEYIKTKTIQDGVCMLRQRGLTPDLILAREPSEIINSSLSKRLEYERIIVDKLFENFRLINHCVVSVPFFTKIDQNYTLFVNKYVLPFIYGKQMIKENNRIKLVIGTKNKNKFNDWSAYLGQKFEVISPAELNLSLDIPEGLNSIEENSKAKARAWVRATGLPTISDDTGFFIKALGDRPGVAVRRWGGEYPEETTNAQFWEILKEKVKDLDDTSCYFKTSVSLAMPDGRIFSTEFVTEGYLDKILLQEKYNGSDYPLGQVFKKNGRETVWANMTNEEKKASDREMLEKVEEMLTTILSTSSSNN